MKGFKIITPEGKTIRFRYYKEALVTATAFEALLPFDLVFMHARTSGQEFWTDQAPPLDIIQENASVFTNPGEVVYGPLNPKRAKTSNCMGIYYGEGKGLDCCNIFATVFEEDQPILASLGHAIWKTGEQQLSFSALI